MAAFPRWRGCENILKLGGIANFDNQQSIAYSAFSAIF
jgi:hypothetical protein